MRAKVNVQFTDGKFLDYGMPRFDEICAAKRVTALTTFAGPDDDELEALAAELDNGETLEPPSFSCSEGIRTVTTILEALQSEKEWSKGFRKNEIRDFIEHLQELEQCLLIGKKKRAKFALFYC